MRIWEVSGTLPGRLAVVERPRGGDWLEDDLRKLVVAGVTCLVSAQPPEEALGHRLEDQAERCAEIGVAFVRLPIQDMTAPPSGGFREELDYLVEALDADAFVAVHCRAGMGRSPMLIAALMVLRGEQPEDTWRRISEARGLPVPETQAQREWVAGLKGR